MSSSSATGNKKEQYSFGSSISPYDLSGTFASNGNEFQGQPGGSGLGSSSPYAALMGGGGSQASAPAVQNGIDYSQNQWQQPPMQQQQQIPQGIPAPQQMQQMPVPMDNFSQQRYGQQNPQQPIASPPPQIPQQQMAPQMQQMPMQQNQQQAYPKMPVAAAGMQPPQGYQGLLAGPQKTVEERETTRQRIFNQQRRSILMESENKEFEAKQVKVSFFKTLSHAILIFSAYKFFQMRSGDPHARRLALFRLFLFQAGALGAEVYCRGPVNAMRKDMQAKYLNHLSDQQLDQLLNQGAVNTSIKPPTSAGPIQPPPGYTSQQGQPSMQNYPPQQMPNLQGMPQVQRGGQQQMQQPPSMMQQPPSMMQQPMNQNQASQDPSNMYNMISQGEKKL